jgi:thiopeptide-type bacteriocin biosynthesis protein
MSKPPSPAKPKGKAPRLVEPSGFFAMRTPLLSFDELIAWGEGMTAAGVAAREGATDGDVEAALKADKQRLRERLRVQAARPEVREALFVASPSLDESFPQWLENPDSERGGKVEKTLVRYFMRMGGRCTPFGLFAGCSVGKLGEVTRLEVVPRTAYERHTRLDMDYVAQLTEALGKDPEMRAALTYRPNSSLYTSAGRLRYAEARVDGRMRSYHLVAVDPTDYLMATMERAKDGARIDQLIDGLCADDAEVTREDAEGFVGELIDSQLLVADLEPTVSGLEPIHGLIATLRGVAQVPIAQAAGEKLVETRDALDALDKSGVGADPQRYRDIAKSLEALPAPVELPRLFQVDMVKPSPEATLGKEVVDELYKGLDILARTGSPRGRDSLRSFVEEFNKRYESAEMPLVEVLDEESGIGFEKSNAPSAEASPLLEGMVFGGGGTAGDPQVGFGARQAFFMRKLDELARTGGREIVLTDEDIKRFERQQPVPFPDAFAVMAQVTAESPEALARGEFTVSLEGAPGPSGATLLGRFCHGDPRLTEEVLTHVRAEEAFQEDAIYAEIVHLPEGRVGNVLHRPLLRQHEIVYLGRSGAPLERQIPITDLMVSIEGGRIILRSKKLGKRVIPRLTNAHNFSHSRNLSVYRFLCQLQYDGLGWMGFSWSPLDAHAFLPRVRYGRLLLATARWRISRDDLAKIADAKGSTARFRAVQELRRRLDLPRWVAVADGDNELPVDFDNALSVETFVQLVKDRGDLTLNEMHQVPGHMAAYGPEGRFTNELVIPHVRVKQAEVEKKPEAKKGAEASPPPPERPQRRPTITVPSAFRTLHPGSEWLYAKIYTGTATADHILREGVAPVVREALSSGAIDSFFFIRYSDPDWHVRVRFHGDPARLLGEVVPALTKSVLPMCQDGRAWKLQLDAYEREIERYGGPIGIQLAEKLFFADSLSILEIVDTLSGDEGSDARWRLALRGIDLLYTDLGISLTERHAIMKQIRESFAREFGGGVFLDRQLGDKFRKLRAELDPLIAPELDQTSWLLPGLEALGRRSERSKAVCAELRAAEQAGKLTAPIADLVGSYIHMHCNRLLRAAQRAQELVLYDFLTRLYESQIARAKKAAKPA